MLQPVPREAVTFSIIQKQNLLFEPAGIPGGFFIRLGSI